MRKCIAIVFVMMGSYAFASDSTHIDLKKSWLMLESGKFVSHSGEGRVAYLKLSDLTEGVIEIRGREFYVFENNKLIAGKVNQFRMPLHRTLQAGGGVLSIFSPHGVNQLVISFITPANPDPFDQKPNSISNALIVVSMLLVAGLILLIRTNAPAALEYFSFVKLFSLRGTEDSAQTMRITSANNVFYYLFCSALIAVNIYVLYYGNTMLDLSFIVVLTSIVKLVALAFGVLVAKILLVSVLSRVFKLKDFGPAQFHNYVRLLLVSFIFCSAFLLILVMVDADFTVWFSRLSYFIAGMSIVFVGVTFLKLIARGGFTVFHLFSYLCASEIIPLIILLNVYFS